MNHTPDITPLLQGNVYKTFLKYLLPGVSASVVVAAYVVVDTMFVGQGLGDTALAALNLCLPVFSILFATGVALGSGGAVMSSIARGQGAFDQASRYFTVCSAAGLGASVLLSLLSPLYIDPLLRLLGAGEETYTYARAYLYPILIAAPGFIMTTLLRYFIRNDDNPRLPMISSICTGVLNVGLDYLFIFPLGMGIMGAAVATAISSVCNVAILSTHFWSKNSSLKLAHVPKPAAFLAAALRCGAPSMILELAIGLITFLFNLQLLRLIGTVGVTIYAAIAATSLVIICVLDGISQSMQPILSVSMGAGAMDRMKKVRGAAWALAASFALLVTLAGQIFPAQLVRLIVNLEGDALEMAALATRVYYVSMVFTGFNVILSGFFQSGALPAPSIAVTLLRGAVLPAAFLFLLPHFFTPGAIWFAIPAAEICTAVIGLILMKIYMPRLEAQAAEYCREKI